MSKLRTILAAAFAVSTLAGCSEPKTIDGVTYVPYGLVNEGELRDPDIQYAVCVGNVVWSIILFETVVAPIYFIGFDVMQPVGKKRVRK